jgi:hypothetical protein
MIIIFGTRRRLTVVNPGETLASSCPHCSGDLVLKENKTWFTLFFLPIFPVNSNGTFYHCNRCDGAYKSEAREYFVTQQAGR